MGSEFEPCWEQQLSPFHVIQAGSGVHLVSHPVGSKGEADCLPPSNAEVKNVWFFHSFILFIYLHSMDPCMAGRLVDIEIVKDNKTSPINYIDKNYE
jgi:hypothetical protein